MKEVRVPEELSLVHSFKAGRVAVLRFRRVGRMLGGPLCWFGKSYVLLPLDELVQFPQRTRNQHHNLSLGVANFASSRKACIVKGIEDRLIFFEDGLGLVSSILPREVLVYVVVEEYNEVRYWLLLFVGIGGCHFVSSGARVVSLFVDCGGQGYGYYYDVGSLVPWYRTG